MRPPDSGDKLDTRGIGPAKVINREGEASYKIEVKPGYTMGANRGSLKPYVKDVFTENPIRLYYHRRIVTDPEGPQMSIF